MFASDRTRCWYYYWILYRKQIALRWYWCFEQLQRVSAFIIPLSGVTSTSPSFHWSCAYFPLIYAPILPLISHFAHFLTLIETRRVVNPRLFTLSSSLAPVSLYLHRIIWFPLYRILPYPIHWSLQEIEDGGRNDRYLHCPRLFDSRRLRRNRTHSQGEKTIPGSVGIRWTQQTQPLNIVGPSYWHGSPLLSWVPLISTEPHRQ